ncbi:hypothetical protein HYPSUDRAFT_69198 [Hypholoma sublateritium FD-334 SS-4]|uniref:Cytochrome P450 n=1 Tax=Hypholoma sublateritium (strain FD-334 SS-4) TaxID=945553 RepID=A0A0D2NRY4_HYPSF|nr:hypothetical protein HYPSUDRAFT_69198 [Hypholoma sublateritium FD-334 SS-4]
MLASLLNVLILYGISWTLWKLYRRFLARSALDNIPGPKAKSFFKGVFSEVFNFNGWDFHAEMAAKYGGVIKIKALFGENQLYVFDPKALHHIIVKDQYIYEETSAFIDGNNMIFGRGLLATLGNEHRKQRKMLNPVFSIAHMREATPIFYDIVHKMEAAFVTQVEKGPKEIEVLSWMSRTALELIGQSGLGYSFDPLTIDAVPHRFSTSVKQLTVSLMKINTPRRYLLPTFVKYTTPSIRRALANLVNWKDLQDIRRIVDVIHETSVEIFESKKKALAEGDEAVQRQIGHGKDILSILMRANMEASESDRLSDTELLGQVSTLIFAAMDTTSSALSRILWLLANHQDVQDKLRQEIREAKRQHERDPVYDDLVVLPYMDAVCRETLRLYSPVSTVTRTTRQDIVLPLSTPINGLDGKEIHEILVPSNTDIIVGLMAANRNFEIWGPDALEWKPERWLSPLPETVASAHIPGVYSHLMTFLGGSRACIGFKFSQLEMKVVLFTMVDSFRFSPTKHDVVWQMGGIATPTLASSKTRYPQLPLVVERAN